MFILDSISTQKSYVNIEIKTRGWKIAQWLQALVLLPGDQNSVLSTYISSQIPVFPASKNSAPSRTLQAPLPMNMLIHIGAHKDGKGREIIS